jgi:hypothetical protein
MPVSCLQTDLGLRRAASTCQSTLEAYYGHMSKHHETGLSAITSLIELLVSRLLLKLGRMDKECGLLGKVGHVKNRGQYRPEELMVQI